ncbi:MAG TPA: glycosyltransferase [Acetobacteraceae bacterium]|jgi:colanic acid/amylovoran biosynthesis glycosyltransferase|nr:glycosyltransferase [Acetobacteraceae bacterium]
MSATTLARPVSRTPSVPTPFLVYRDRIGTPSEIQFLRRQYLGFTRLAPVWVGRHIMPLASELGGSVVRLGGTWLSRALFQQIGLVPRLDVGRVAPVLHAQFARGGALALPLARARGLRMVVTLWGGDVSKAKNWRGTVQARRWPEVVAATSRFVCVSAAIADMALTHRVPADKLVVLPIGAEIPPVPPPAPLAPTYHLFVGRFVAKKGVQDIADAVRRLRAEGDITPIVFVGDGPLRPTVESLARDVRGVELAGWLRPDDVRARMAQAWSLLVPSVVAPNGDAEGLPSVIFEAMAQACAVIGTNEGGVAEAVDHERTGLLVPPRDPAALAAAMRRLVTDSALRHRLAQAGYDHARRNLNAHTQSVALENLLLEVAA